MTTNPIVPIGARLRLINLGSSVPIEPGVGGVLNVPPDQDGRCTFPVNPFNPDGSFIAPQAGFYRFNTAAEVIGTGLLVVTLEDAMRARQSAARYQGNDGLAVSLCVTLDLNKGDVVRRLLAVYGSPEPLLTWNRPDSNYYEIEYLG